MPDPVTWQDVVSQAVQIGLPTIVGGYVAIRLARLSQKHELTKLRFERQQETVESVASGLERVHTLFMEGGVQYAGIPDSLNAGLKLDAETVECFHEYLRKFGAGLRELHVLEGRLLLIKARQAAEKMKLYRSRCTDINCCICLQKGGKSRAEVMEMVHALHRARAEAYAALSDIIDVERVTRGPLARIASLFLTFKRPKRPAPPPALA